MVESAPSMSHRIWMTLIDPGPEWSIFHNMSHTNVALINPTSSLDPVKIEHSHPRNKL